MVRPEAGDDLLRPAVHRCSLHRHRCRNAGATPTYIILAAIVAPALYQLGVPQLATHFFVFYFGVLADVTRPVALVAFAAAGIARSEHPWARG